MTQQLFIPKKLKIGFQNRKDTFTGKLAYVIYYDEKNKLRKEKSWEGWRDDNIESIEFDNIPTSGYIFNKGVQRSNEWFGSGRSVIRVYDPRDFEFEINVDNLINMLMHSDVSKREIMEECVFAWAGTELVLLPINSADYQASIEYTAKQDNKVSAKNLIKGVQYAQRKNDRIVTYIGYFEWFERKYMNSGYGYVNKGKKHIFHTGSYFETISVSTLSHAITNDIVDNYSELVDTVFGTFNAQPISKYIVTDKQSFDGTLTYYNTPQIYKIVNDNTILKISTGHYGYMLNNNNIQFNDQHNTSTFKLNWYTLTDTADGLRYDNIKNITNSLYTNNYSRWMSSLDPHTIEFTQLIDFVQQNGVDGVISIKQYLDFMFTLGFGRLDAILANDRIIENIQI